MKMHKMIRQLFTKKYYNTKDLCSVYNISDEEIRFILSKKENPVLSLDLDLKDRKFL